MKGVQGFASARLTEAREARGLTATSLAGMVNVSAVTISSYENGRSAPAPDTLLRIATTLGFPISFFTRWRPSRPGAAGPVFWRSRSSATKSARTRCAQRLAWLSDITAYLRQFVDLPKLDLPRLKLPDAKVFDWTASQVEDLAAQARAGLGLGTGPIPDVLLILENAGVIVSKFALDAETLDAFSHWHTDGLPYVVIGSDKRSLARQHYNAAHEFAHLLLHATISDSELNRTDQQKIVEAQAFRFASAFLLPEKSFTSELWAPTFTAFESMKTRWGASIGVMITRCRELDIITDDQARWMWIKYSRNGYKKAEPLDDLMPDIAPRLLRRSIEMLVDEGIQSKDEIRSALALPEAEVEALCSLRPGYLSDAPPATVIELPRIKAPADRRVHSDGNPVLRFEKARTK